MSRGFWGGNWNLEPYEVTDLWYRSEAALIAIGSATQQLGRNIDWCLSSLRVSVAKVEAEVISGTDRVGVILTLEAVNRDTLGTRIEQPTVVAAEDFEVTKETGWHQQL